jgi:hypothetical protein
VSTDPFRRSVPIKIGHKDKTWENFRELWGTIKIVFKLVPAIKMVTRVFSPQQGFSFVVFWGG